MKGLIFLTFILIASCGSKEEEEDKLPPPKPTREKLIKDKIMAVWGSEKKLYKPEGIGATFENYLIHDYFGCHAWKGALTVAKSLKEIDVLVEDITTYPLPTFIRHLFVYHRVLIICQSDKERYEAAKTLLERTYLNADPACSETWECLDDYFFRLMRINHEAR